MKDHQKIEVDYILFRENPEIKIEQIDEYFLFEKIIFDASNSHWKIKKWIKECNQFEISFHNILENGAFEISLE